MNRSLSDGACHAHSAAVAGIDAAALLALGDEIATSLEDAVCAVAVNGDASLAQMVGALRFVGAQGGAALVELLAKAGASRRHDHLMAGEVATIRGDCAHALRAALQAMALGQSTPASGFLPCWQRLAALSPEIDTHPCQLLSLAPATTNGTAITHAGALYADASVGTISLALLVGEIDRALLDFLRCPAGSARQRAAQSIAVAIASLAARQSHPDNRLRWRVLQAFAEEIAAGQRHDSLREKRILSAAGRQARRLQRYANHVPDDTLLREALYEMACHPCLTPVAKHVSDVYALPEQFPPQALAASRLPVDDDVTFERDWQGFVATCDEAGGAMTTLSQAVPSAARMARAFTDAVRDCIASIERHVDAARERSAWRGVIDQVRPLLRQIDAGVQMAGHPGLQAIVRAAVGELDRLAQRSTIDDAGGGHDDNWLAFATRLATLETDLATLPFRREPVGAEAKPVPGIDDGVAAIHMIDAELGSTSSPSLREIFMQEACARLDTLSASLLSWEAMPATGLAAQACVDAHALAGSASTVGWPAIHLLSQALERACEACAKRRFSKDDVRVLGEAIAAIRSLLAEGKEQGGAAGASLIDSLLALAQDMQQENTLNRSEVPAGVAIEAASATVEPAMPLAVPANSVLAADRQPGQATVPDAMPDTELHAIFHEEAADLLPQLDHAMRAWLARPDDPAPPAHLMRVLHTMKGSARMAGRPGLGDAFHGLESSVSGLLAVESLSSVPLSALQDELDAVLETCRRDAGAPPDIALPVVASPSKDMPLPAVTTGPASKPSVRLRVPAELLERMTDSAAELLAGMHEQSDDLLGLRQDAGDLADNLSRLRVQLRELEIEADARIASQVGDGKALCFDPLEFDRYTRVHELARAMSESVADLAEVQRMLARRAASIAWSNGLRQRQSRALHADLLSAGTSPFGSVEARLLQSVRQALRDAETEAETAAAGHSAPNAEDAKRAVRLQLDGGELAIDRSLLERLAAPLEHLIRNAIVHGIEPVAERERSGKPRCARLRVSLSRDANQWRLEVADDGRGLDLSRLRERAAAMGLAGDDGVRKEAIDDSAIAELIFVRGLSTRDKLTGLAGRGIGMDAVRAAVQSLGGAIRVYSESGRGCRFVLDLPLTLAILPVLVCHAGPYCIGVPSAMVRHVLGTETIKPADGVDADTVEWQGETYRRQSLARMLHLPAGAITRRSSSLLLAQAGNRLALAVDNVVAHAELMMRDPGPQLASVPGMIGASLATGGGVVLVMNPFALAGAVPPCADDMANAADAGVMAVAPPAIMVVDDSLTVRRAAQGLLQRQGYQVMLARDGAEALALLADVGAPAPRAMLLDIEMPKMDGFELLSLLRGDARWQQLPVVMITSRTADKHRERALQLGATAYVGKPYQEEELVALLARLVASTSTAHETAASLPSCTA